jgi:hypothetical protein
VDPQVLDAGPIERSHEAFLRIVQRSPNQLSSKQIRMDFNEYPNTYFFLGFE